MTFDAVSGLMTFYLNGVQIPTLKQGTPVRLTGARLAYFDVLFALRAVLVDLLESGSLPLRRRLLAEGDAAAPVIAPKGDPDYRNPNYGYTSRIYDVAAGTRVDNMRIYSVARSQADIAATWHQPADLSEI